MADIDERLIRILKQVVIAGAVVLVLGTALLVGLLVTRERAPPPAEATTLALPAGARITQALAAGNQLVLLGEDKEGQRFIALVDPATGRRHHTLRIVPESP